MKQRNAARIVLNILIGLLIAAMVVAAGALAVARFVVLPKYEQKLREQGRGEIAEAVKNNNNLGAFATLGKLLSNPDVVNFLSNINRETATSVLDVLDTLDSEYTEETAGEQVGPWIVSDSMQTKITKPAPAPTPAPTEAPALEVPKNPTAKTPQTAYERIAAAATTEDMADGLAIISKLDVGYVTSLTAGGLTSEEKKELSKYVHSVLSGAEMSRAVQLYRTYSKYL